MGKNAPIPVQYRIGGREPAPPPGCPWGMSDAAIMDSHTLDLLEFGKVRELLAGYAASSLGKELARGLEPSTDADAVRAELALTSEMVDVLGQGQAPPFGGLHDVRLVVRRAAIGAQLTIEQLLEVADTLGCTGTIYRYRFRLGERHVGLSDLLAPVEDLGPVAKSISGCIDGRGHVLDMASPELAQIRQKINDVDDRVQHHIRRLLHDPKLREILRYPNATVSGDHYVLPVAVNHRHKIQGVVHRTSATGETVFIEPAGVANLSSERAVLKGDEDREVRRILRAAERRGRPSGEAACLRHRHPRPPRSHHRQGPFQPRLRHVRPGRQYRRPALAAAGAASAADPPVPRGQESGVRSHGRNVVSDS